MLKKISRNLFLEVLLIGLNVTQKLIETHLIEGKMEPGQEIGIKIDQTLTQDATGARVMLDGGKINWMKSRLCGKNT